MVRYVHEGLVATRTDAVGYPQFYFALIADGFLLRLLRYQTRVVRFVQLGLKAALR